jgi:glycosyltransferase involved in cell wall biosynthesis
VVHSLPRVSVVMPVYNGKKYLREAVDSILAQTFNDFELIIIDDGSTDSTADILNEYKDERIKLVKNIQNRGISFSTNKGISIASGKYIAKMDCDDISYPDRFMAQVQLLDENIDIDVVGSWIEYIGQDSQPIGKIGTYLGSAMGLRWFTFFNTPLANPAVMMRRRFFDFAGQYDEKFAVIQDYELWVRSNLASRFSNIQKVLLKYRIHESNISKKRTMTEKEMGYRMSQKYFNLYLGKEIPINAIKVIQNPQKAESLEAYKSSIYTLYQMNKKFHKDYCLQPQEIVDINLDYANRLSQIAYKNPHILYSWLLRAYAIALVIFTLMFNLVKNKRP